MQTCRLCVCLFISFPGIIEILVIRKRLNVKMNAKNVSLQFYLYSIDRNYALYQSKPHLEVGT